MAAEDAKIAISNRVWFVANCLRVETKLPCELIPYHFLRRASDAEVAAIQTFLARYTDFPYRVVYEEKWVPEDPEKPKGQQYTVSLDRQEWRYFVIEPPQEGHAIEGVGRVVDYYQHDLEKAARLCAVELRCGVTLHPEGFGHMSTLGGTVLPRWRHVIVEPDVLGDRDVEEIRIVFRLLQVLDQSFADIRRAIDMFYRLREIKESEMYILGLFAVIECLLTHDPKGSYDSLGHQIRSKIPLLDKRMKRPIDYTAFGDTRVDQLWRRLYEYRSTVAHGGQPDFGGSLQVLKSRDIVSDFLDTVVKALIRHALDEPELVLDLRAV
jgi:hypothetical protein